MEPHTIPIGALDGWSFRQCFASSVGGINKSVGVAVSGLNANYFVEKDGEVIFETQDARQAVYLYNSIRGDK